ncbi:MAG: hypothetical protein LW865_14460 [Betaproteobacteria bacterium]|jgi:hypothetical protein|nr:hypothetical protein [Betaproteobacteria bacterium]
MPNNQDDRRGWHLDKTINASHLLITCGAIVTAGIFISQQDKRIALLENFVVQQKATDASQDARSAEAKTEIKADLKDIKEDVKLLVRQSGARR